jgi:endonuclease/exonuclease/phosphatase family metal-dependent hydrolase
MNNSIRKHCLLLTILCTSLLARPSHAELPNVLRVITYNIHHGEGTDAKIDLERIANVLLAEKPDLVAVNEVDQGTNRTRKIDMPAELARLTGLKAIFEKNIDHDGGCRFAATRTTSSPRTTKANSAASSKSSSAKRTTMRRCCSSLRTSTTAPTTPSGWPR